MEQWECIYFRSLLEEVAYDNVPQDWELARLLLTDYHAQGPAAKVVLKLIQEISLNAPDHEFCYTSQ